MAEKLTEDLMVEILCRLPVKCLVGLKCLSKTWNMLISNVCIPRISRSPSPVSGFVFHSGRLSNRKERFIDYLSYSDDICNENATTSDGFVKPFSGPSWSEYSPYDCDGFVESFSSLLPSEYSPYDLLDCCNGLILLGSRSVPRYFVCNPATKQCVAIPKVREHVEVYHAALAFDPCESSQYKIIRFIYVVSCSASNPPGVDIFSSETGNWIRRKLPVEPAVAYGFPWVKHSVYLDGMCYKLSLSKHLLCININALTAQAVDVPYKDKVVKYGFIGVCKGVLNYANHDRSRIFIWQFDCHRKTDCFWVLKHCICISDLPAKHPAGWNLDRSRNSSLFMPYAIHPVSDIIFLGLPSMVFSYHLENHNLELLCRKPIDKKIAWGHCCFFPYSRCFIMLNDVNKTRHKSSHLETILKGTRDMKLETRIEDEEQIDIKRAMKAA